MAIYENIKHITGSLNSEYEVKISIQTIITHVLPAKVRAMKPAKPVESRGSPQYPSTNFILANECKCMCKTSESKTDIKVFKICAAPASDNVKKAQEKELTNRFHKRYSYNFF